MFAMLNVAMQAESSGTSFGAIGFLIFGILVIAGLIWLIRTDPDKKEKNEK